MQGADWLLRCRKNRGGIETSQCDSWGILCPVCEETGEIYTRNRSRTMFFVFTKYGPCYHHCKKKQQQQARQLQQKTCLVGGELKKKTVNMFLESYSAIFSKMQF